MWNIIFGNKTRNVLIISFLITLLSQCSQNQSERNNKNDSSSQKDSIMIRQDFNTLDRSLVVFSRKSGTLRQIQINEGTNIFSTVDFYSNMNIKKVKYMNFDQEENDSYVNFGPSNRLIIDEDKSQFLSLKGIKPFYKIDSTYLFKLKVVGFTGEKYKLEVDSTVVKEMNLIFIMNDTKTNEVIFSVKPKKVGNNFIRGNFFCYENDNKQLISSELPFELTITAE